MVADKGKKSKAAAAEQVEEEDSDHIDGELVLSIEKLQEIQDELEKVYLFAHNSLLSSVGLRCFVQLWYVGIESLAYYVGLFVDGL